MSHEHDHSPEAIQARFSGEARHSYLRDWIYGGIDGAVTTFAIVCGVMGAKLGAKPVLILGVANLIADGFSMAASNYLGTRTELAELQYYEELEKKHIADFPEGEREEVRQIFQRKGLQGDVLEKVVQVITSDSEHWIRTMLVDEWGLPPSVRKPSLAAASTFAAFLVCGGVPLLPFLVHLPNAFEVSIGMTGFVFFGIGAMKARWSVSSWWSSGLITLALGGMASFIAYAIGVLLGTG